MFKILRGLILACFVVLMLPGNAAAEINAAEFLKKYDSTTGEVKTRYLQYLNGNSNGLSWANTFVGLEYPQAKIYCPPKKFKSTATQTVTLLRRFVAKFPKYKTSPVGAVMLFALKDKWPRR